MQHLHSAHLPAHLPPLLTAAPLYRSHSPQVRSSASAALLAFLLDYPLSPRRLSSHMAFLLTNTGYEYEQGRLQALDMLQQVPPVCVCVLSAESVYVFIFI